MPCASMMHDERAPVRGSCVPALEPSGGTCDRSCAATLGATPGLGRHGLRDCRERAARTGAPAAASSQPAKSRSRRAASRPGCQTATGGCATAERRARSRHAASFVAGLARASVAPGCARRRRPAAVAEQSHKTIGYAAIGHTAQRVPRCAAPPTVAALNRRRTEADRPRRPAIELRDGHQAVRHADGGIYTALRDLDLAVEHGQFCAVVGPTGCGKSTTLTLVSGLERPARGRGSGRTAAGPRHRRPASGSCSRPTRCCPWKTVLDNVAAGPGLPRREPSRGARAGARLAAPGRPGRLRGPLPAPAVRRHAQAGRAGADA